MLAQNEKIALFIDGANLLYDSEIARIGFLREFQSRGHLLRAFYYTAVFEDQESFQSDH